MDRRFRLTPMLIMSFVLTGAGCERQAETRQLEGTAFGTRYQIVLADEDMDTSSLAAEIEGTLDALDQTFSTWRPDSEISRINAAEAGRDLPLSVDFQRVLAEARTVHELSGGALDIALLPLTLAWGFQGEADPAQPSDAMIRSILAYSGMGHLSFSEDGTRLRKHDARQGLDVSAVAKGYAIDRMGERLRKAGATNYLVEFGGEVLAMGNRPGGAPWRVAVESIDSGQPLLPLALSNEAVATSGDYRNHIVVDGRRLGHVLDPVTGRPAGSGVVAATVIAGNALRADALATAFLLMDEAAAFELAESLGVGLRRVTLDSAGLISRDNAAFRKRLASPP